MNIGADSITGYGEYFAWGEIETYYKDGHALDDTITDGNWKTGYEDGYTWSSYTRLSNGASDQLKKYCCNPAHAYAGQVDSITVLELADDVARQIWQGKWRMPTSQEFDKLLNKELTDGGAWIVNFNGTGIDGLLVKAKEGTRFAGNEVFFPAATFRFSKVSGLKNIYGRYWSSTLNYTSYYGNTLEFNVISIQTASYPRIGGLSVRPVCD